MSLNEVTITKAIVEEFLNIFMQYSEVDVALVGGGPANLVAATCLAKEGAKAFRHRNAPRSGGNDRSSS